MYLTYEEYKALGGEVPLEAFPKYERMARAAVDYYTFGRIKEPTNAVKDCMSALIDFGKAVDDATESEGKAVSSETVGSHTVSYFSGLAALGITESGKSKKQLEYEIVAQHLMNTGLMYRGVE